MLRRALSGRSQHSGALASGHDLSSFGHVIFSGPAVYPTDPVLVLEHSHSNIHAGLPSLTSLEGDSNDSATFYDVPQFWPSEDHVNPVDLHASPSSAAFPNEFFLNDLGQPQQQEYYVALPFDQPTLAAYPPPWAFPTSMSYSQGSTSSPDIQDHSNDWPANSQNRSPPMPFGVQNASNPHSREFGVHKPSFSQSTSTDKLPSGETPFIIIEDPTHPGTYREKKHRSREDLAKQKQASHDLKVSGGACVWCYRSKKKCDASPVCHPCRSGNRKCIRDSAQLSLLAPIVTISNSTSAVPQSPPSHKTIATLNYLGATVFQKAEALTAVLNIRQPHGGNLHTWAMNLTRADLTLPNNTKAAIDQFLAKAIICGQGSQLSRLENVYGSHPLVQEALKMAKLFLAVSGIAKTSICTHPDHLGAARLTMLLVMVAGSQRLVEISQFFSVGLHDALRRKDLQDNYCGGQYSPQTNDPLHPLWVAYALYYRVISGLLGLEPDSPIANIFQSLEPHLDEAHKTTWSVIINLSPCPRHLKRRPKLALREDIPVLSSASHFDLSFSTSIEAWGNGSAPQMMLGQDDPDLISEPSYGVEVLLDVPWTQPVFFPNNALASQNGLRPSSEPQMARSLFGSILRIGSSDSSSIDPTVLNLLDPTAVPQGELRDTIDTVMLEEPPCFIR
ncbi:hypothetical protein N7476_003008 [Penicillium atrosanguineum]|uniref:Zn(2)-C6 fungal-type domain-containing protein n=1 Tax=Penicillium atrosanguineum TaxID=1132637 RepID=A0A9W9U975_9EURO|nr:hypothetical protein N7476_003008 [Penicillium atrosanguineum]